MFLKPLCFICLMIYGMLLGVILSAAGCLQIRLVEVRMVAGGGRPLIVPFKGIVN